MGSMQIDFRKHVDPRCKYNPKILACDGTYTGVSMRQMNLTAPVTKAESLGANYTTHKRYGMPFFHL